MHISMLIISTYILVLFVTFVTGFEVTEKQREILMKATVEYENDISMNEEMVAFPSVVTPSLWRYIPAKIQVLFLTFKFPF